MQRPPYFDWRLDRWKIGLALLLWLGLLVFSPTQPPRPTPQEASPIARPGQRPVVGASTQTGTVQALTEESAQMLAQPLPTAEATLPQQTVEAASLNPNPPKLMILEPGQRPLTNSTPLFFWQTEADRLVEILMESASIRAVAYSECSGPSWARAKQPQFAIVGRFSVLCRRQQEPLHIQSAGSHRGLQQSSHSLPSFGGCPYYISVNKSRCIFGVLGTIVVPSRATTICHRRTVIAAMSASARAVAYSECWKSSWLPADLY